MSMGNDLQLQIEAFKSAPLVYIVALLTVGILIWAASKFLYGHRIEGLKEELDRERRETERLRISSAQPASLATVSAKKPERKQSATLANRQPAALIDLAPDEQTRIYLGSNVTGGFLRAFYKNRTQHQGDQAIQPYIGKWMQVEGAVRNIYPRRQNWDVLILNKGSDEVVGSAMINCVPSETAKLEILQKGDMIKAEGRVKRANANWIFLEQGRLL